MFMAFYAIWERSDPENRFFEQICNMDDNMFMAFYAIWERSDPENPFFEQNHQS
jgi:hypothetical protein